MFSNFTWPWIFFDVMGSSSGKSSCSANIAELDASVEDWYNWDIAGTGCFPNFSLMRTTSNEGSSAFMLLDRTLTMKVNLWPINDVISGGVCVMSYNFRRVSAFLPMSYVPHFSKIMNLRVYVPSVTINGILYMKTIKNNKVEDVSDCYLCV